MAKIRVGQLAKELNLKVSEVLARLRELGAEVKSNLSTVEEELAGQMRSNLGARGPTPAAVPDAGGKSTAKATPHKPATGHGDPVSSVVRILRSTARHRRSPRPTGRRARRPARLD